MATATIERKAARIASGNGVVTHPETAGARFEEITQGLRESETKRVLELVQEIMFHERSGVVAELMALQWRNARVRQTKSELERLAKIQPTEVKRLRRTGCIVATLNRGIAGYTAPSGRAMRISAGMTVTALYVESGLETGTYWPAKVLAVTPYGAFVEFEAEHLARRVAGVAWGEILTGDED